MSEDKIKVTVEGLEEALKKLDPARLYRPVRWFFERSLLQAQNRARQNAPVDTGRLRADIDHEIDNAPVPLWGKVYTNVEYAPFMEYGTGIFAEGEGGGGSGHFPPGDALEPWAQRHGFESGFQVARIIAARGGLRPRRFMRDALKESQSDIEHNLKKLGDDIREEFDH